ncbi:hypothetical protein MKQ70_37120 [Chitinophaga sedimenti]|uniref:hypothetical protein n=1 Tax=Chitinophaga sedimenti TaxID=2033606 RepID=UPI002004CF69|nr:hypothetical protein [Chitinophaga sedimenti]MCK7560222.1 hypothetical protein [Chitinophaga sedimenti]MCK7560232.1 hypothetical protein [Chitinophaga sedimenti]
MGKALDQEMHDYFMRLNEAEKKSVVQMLKTFLKGRKEPVLQQTLADYNRELEEGDAAIEAGDFVSHEEVMKRYGIKR